MKTIEEKRLEFLEDTVKYYSEDVSRRSFDVIIKGNYIERCLYRGKNGKTCAIGRWIPNEKYSDKMEGLPVNNSLVYNSVDKSITSLDNSNRKFLAKIQVLHDTPSYWDANGISFAGENFINKIKQEFCK